MAPLGLNHPPVGVPSVDWSVLQTNPVSVELPSWRMFTKSFVGRFSTPKLRYKLWLQKTKITIHVNGIDKFTLMCKTNLLNGIWNGAEISGLVTFTNYTVQVAAITSAGVGEYSDPPLIVNTTESTFYCSFYTTDIYMTFSYFHSCNQFDHSRCYH